MKVRVEARLLSHPSGAYPQGAVLEMNEAEASVAVAEGNVSLADDGAEVSVPVPGGWGHVREQNEASVAAQARAHAEAKAVFAAHEREVRVAVGALVQRGLVREVDRDAALGVFLG